LEACEFRVLGEPDIPAGEERLALALANEDAVEVAAGNTQFPGRQRRAGKADQAALGLVRGGGHRLVIAVWDGMLLDFLCVAASVAATE
jgi:hypothetical protein